MVSSQFCGLTKTSKSNPIRSQLLFPTNTTHCASPDPVNLDFSDVFGSISLCASTEVVDVIDLDFNACQEDSRELIYDDPEVIYHRSHSLVGPSFCANQTLISLSKLTIPEDSRVACISKETNNKLQEPLSDSLTDRILEDVDRSYMKVESVGIDNFEVLKVVGQGAFAKVYQVRRKGTLEIYAMKVMRKDKIMEKNHVEYMKAERDILTKTDHPFIVQLRYSFQTKYRLYLVLDFVNGGHLFFQLYHHGLFKEDLARIYAAEIVLAVSHLHSNGIMHRDLKPENILLDDLGHVMLTDFGVAKQFEENTRSNSICGTVEYMSPEIVLGKGHDKAADWWSVGILLFEMLTGKPPFTGNREKVQQRIVKDKIKLPAYLSSEAHSLLKGLLQREASKRLGSEEIKRHKWFKPINWKKLEKREIQPSFRPEVAGKHCVANFEKRWTEMPLVDSPIVSPKTEGNPFTGFSYVKPAASFSILNSETDF